MKPVPTIIITAALAALASCGGGNGMPGAKLASDGPPPTFAGTGIDSNPNTGAAGTGTGTTVVTFTMMQSGATVSGTVTTQSTDAPGTCASCHRSRTGMLSGTISGTTLKWTASFPVDPAHDPTPSCGAKLTGEISDITADSMSGTYSGQDDCEGQYSKGTLTMSRQAPAAP
jgi:hypothetical protein